MDYEDFRYLILPREAFYKSAKLKNSIDKRKTKPHEFLTVEIENKIYDIFYAETQFQRCLERLKIEIEKLPEFNLQLLFKFMDLNNYNFIDETQIKKFLTSQRFKDIIKNTRAINSILRRMNKYRKLKVTFSDFAEFLSPMASNCVIGKFDPREQPFYGAAYKISGLDR